MKSQNLGTHIHDYCSYKLFTSPLTLFMWVYIPLAIPLSTCDDPFGSYPLPSNGCHQISPVDGLICEDAHVDPRISVNCVLASTQAESARVRGEGCDDQSSGTKANGMEVEFPGMESLYSWSNQ